VGIRTRARIHSTRIRRARGRARTAHQPRRTNLQLAILVAAMSRLSAAAAAVLLCLSDAAPLAPTARARECPGGDLAACAAACAGANACLNRCTLLCSAPVCQRATAPPPPLHESQMTSRGPPVGSLVVAGGSVFSGSAIYDRFAELASPPAGEDYIIFVPTANGGPFETPAQIAAAIASLEASTGWTVRALVHTYDPAVANTPEFSEEIDRASGVWFGGGRQWRISDAYLGTAAQLAFGRVLQRGGAIISSSQHYWGSIMRGRSILDAHVGC
jgi:hypothetical protein